MDNPIWRPQAYFTHELRDSNGVEELNETGGISVRFIPPRRSIGISFKGSQSKLLCIWTTSSKTGFMSSPKFIADLVTIRFVDRGNLVRENQGGESHTVGVQQAMLTSFDIMRRENASPNFSSTCATLTRSSLLAACDTMFGPGSCTTPVFESVVELRTPGLQAVRETVMALQRRLSVVSTHLDLVTPLMEEVLRYQLVGNWPLVKAVAPCVLLDSGRRTVRSCIEFMEANLANRITVLQIAEAAGVGVRAIQLAFKREFGRSPVQYLLERRLDQVNARLRAGDGRTIAAIAGSFGFTHMSDFTMRYRKRFGRLPSDDFRS